MANVPELFGSNVFGDSVMKERLPKETYKALKKTISEGKSLDISVANVVANAMKDWAIEKGATHFTHWFQPMTGITAEKHDSFISPTTDGKVIMEFSGKELIKGEPDASSFPSGGTRATFEARGYTVWDPTSYAFIKDGSLCIPTLFCSYTGDVLDKKTPLLRSMDVIDKEAKRLLAILGNNVEGRVVTTVGPEQEYFLIDKKLYDKRKDLIFCGRTLFGAKAPKGQELEDHYFGAIKPRISAFMKELDEELWKLGILAKTKHNEVAPAQHELAPIFSTTNIASDHNQLTMEMLKSVALRHGLVCLLHEKPFAGINGSGKHNNWSISTSKENLLEPGKDPYNNTQFLVMLAAIVKGVDEHQELLRVSVASAGNDHRLGANEAPPAIISIFLGDELTDIVNAIVDGREYVKKSESKMELGVSSVPTFTRDNTDRNRTSPFAFTGNKFEFRMLGSSVNIACPNIILNTIVAEQFTQFAEELEGAEDVEKAARDLIKRVFTEHKRIIFNGDGYTDEWVAEAEKRGLYNLKSMPEALPHYITDKSINLFVKHDVYTAREMHARYEIQLEDYCKIINIEALTMLDMAKKDIFPAVSAYTKELSDSILAKKSVCGDMVCDAEIDLVKKLSALLSDFYAKIKVLEDAVINAATVEGDIAKKSMYYRNSVFASMQELRAVADELETLTSGKDWPFPTYGELLFNV